MLLRKAPHHLGRLSLFLIVAACSVELTLVACSSDHPAGAGDDPAQSMTDSEARVTIEIEASANPPDAMSTIDDAGTTPADAGDDGEAEPSFVCLDDTALVTEGGTPADACPDSPTCSTYCNNVHAHYKLGVAQAAIACILNLSSCSTPSDVKLCVSNALARACVDATSKGYCTPLVMSCDPNAGGPGSNIDESGCESLASAFSAAGRSMFDACLQAKTDAGTCAAEVGGCADAMLL